MGDSEEPGFSGMQAGSDGRRIVAGLSEKILARCGLKPNAPIIRGISLGRSRAMTGPRNLLRSNDSVDQQDTEEQRKHYGVIDAVNNLHIRHGFLSDEFSTL